jgi:hypothetical protein
MKSVTAAFLIACLVLLRPAGCPAQGETPAVDRQYFLILPISLRTHIFDAPTSLRLLDEHVRRDHPELWNPKTSFKWSCTIGRLAQDSGMENLFYSGYQPGNGEIVIEDVVTGGRSVISVNVAPAVDAHPFSTDVLVSFPEHCQIIESPCGIELGAAPAAPARNLLLDTLAGESADYAYVREKGVIDLGPKPGAGGGSVLDRKIKGSLVIQEMSAVKAVSMVLDQAGIQAELSPKMGLLTKVPFPDISVRLKNRKVRDCLNDIVRADGQAIWYFKDLGKGRYAYNVTRWAHRRPK